MFPFCHFLCVCSFVSYSHIIVSSVLYYKTCILWMYKMGSFWAQESKSLLACIHLFIPLSAWLSILKSPRSSHNDHIEVDLPMRSKLGPFHTVQQHSLEHTIEWHSCKCTYTLHSPPVLTVLACPEVLSKLCTDHVPVVYKPQWIRETVLRLSTCALKLRLPVCITYFSCYLLH